MPKTVTLPHNAKWSSIWPRFRLPLEKINDEDWSKISDDEKRRHLQDSIDYITTRIPWKILWVLISAFTIPSTSLETGELLEEPWLMSRKWELRLDMYWAASWEWAKKEALDLFHHFLEENTPNHVRMVLLRFSEYVKWLLSMDEIDTDSDFFQLLPTNSKQKVLIYKLKKRLHEAWGKYTIEDINKFLTKYAKSLQSLLWVDPLLMQYWNIVINTYWRRPQDFNSVDIETLRILMGQEQTWAIIREIMPAIWREWESTRVTEILTPIAKEEEWILSDWFSFHINQWNPVEVSDRWIQAVAEYYKWPLQDVLQALKIERTPNTRLERLDERSSLIEGKMWWVVPEKISIWNEPDHVTRLRLFFDAGRKLNPGEIEALYNLFRKEFPGTNTYLKSTSGTPLCVVGGFLKPWKTDTTEGVFGSNGFLDNSVVIVSRDKVDSVFIHLWDYSVDMALYLAYQFDSIIRDGKVLEASVAWTKIMLAYNEQLIGKNDVFDINQTTQYREFIQSVIVPHSDKWKTRRHTLLCGLPGSGKSQYTFNLLTKREYALWNKEFHLACIVVPLTIWQLGHMVSSDASWVRQRILNIHRKTGRHILLVVEDIDSLAWEAKDDEWKNSSSQGLTNLLDGIGKTSYMTIVATSNYPHHLPGRLVRKGRFDNVLEFDGFQDIEEVWNAVSVYIRKYSLSWYSEEIIHRFCQRMVGFTWSMVADFIQRIREENDFRALMWQNTELSESDISEIFENLHVSRSDFEEQTMATRDWISSVKNWGDKPTSNYIL